jgi:hypothetical protein
VAGLARFVARDLNRGFNAAGGFLECDLEVVPQIGAALRAAATAAGTEDIAKSEYVAEAGKDV